MIYRLIYAVLALLFSCHAHGTWELGKVAFDRGDHSAAINIWKQLAEAGDTNSQMLLGAVYEAGRGIEQDSQKALALRTRAAQGGVAAAQVEVALHHLNGRGTKKDCDKAIEWFKLAASNNNAVAKQNLGMLHLGQNCLSPNFEMAAGYFRSASKLGDSFSMYAMGMLHKKSLIAATEAKKSEISKQKLTDLERKKQLFSNSISSSQQLVQQLNLSLQRNQVALDSALAQRNSLSDVNFFGASLATISPGVRKSVEIASERVRVLLAEQSQTQQILASSLMTLSAVERQSEANDRQIEKTMSLEASQQKDAFEWFALAAAEGNGEATYQLAEMYEKGNQVAANSGVALALFRLSKSRGISAADESVKQLEGSITEDQRSLAKRYENLLTQREGFSTLIGLISPK
jgi:uncharacterized protein